MKRLLLFAILVFTAAQAIAQTREYPSPDGLYCLLYNAQDQEYYMHDNRLDYTYCITCDDADDLFDDTVRPAWRLDSRYVYLSGRYDIWQIDITRAVAPLKISKRKKDAPVKYYLMLEDGLVHDGQYVFMETVNTVTGETGRASFYQKGYKYRYRTY